MTVSLRHSLVLLVATAALIAGTSAASAATSDSAVRAPKLSVDLESGLVNGQRILGRSISSVTAAIGKPTWREAAGARYKLGYGDRTDLKILVLFRKASGHFRAVTVAFERAPVYDATSGQNVLAVPPAAFAREAVASYPNLRVDRAPRCVAKTCTVVLRVAGDSQRLTFGHTASKGGFLSLWTP
jgi:hypothetical protein